MVRGSILDLGLLRPQLASLIPTPRILVCGDADFAYTLALEKSLRGRRCAIFTSAYEREAELMERYPHAAESMSTLLKAGVAVQCGVDARELSTHYGQDANFDRIVFNLPQSPPAPKARNQIQRHRALLHDFCASAAGALSPFGEVWITLLAGQGGTVLDPIARAPGDTWQIQNQAADAGLLVRAVAQADLDALSLAGYVTAGRRNHGGQIGSKRKEKGLVVHVLAPEPWSDSDGAGAAVAQRQDIDDQKNEDELIVGVSPLEWILDNSFWMPESAVDAEIISPTRMLDICREALGAHAAHSLVEEPKVIDVYKRPEDGRHARTYRFTYRSNVIALSRDRAIKLNAVVCAALERAFELESRTSNSFG